ncbi:MAG: hypothetical protein AMS20_00025 [Gemmatimonas sp. SG8_28]|nr:MAG: hypothetical protein AMS20_00025 [Gemmatimonas sp. SG8_28]
MPKGTKVHKIYEKLLAKGYSKGKAARIAQSKTGQSLQTGRPSKRASLKKIGRNRYRVKQ